MFQSCFIFDVDGANWSDFPSRWYVSSSFLGSNSSSSFSDSTASSSFPISATSLAKSFLLWRRTWFTRTQSKERKRLLMKKKMDLMSCCCSKYSTVMVYKQRIPKNVLPRSAPASVQCQQSFTFNKREIHFPETAILDFARPRLSESLRNCQARDFFETLTDLCK